jgi:acyl carrier protein
LDEVRRLAPIAGVIHSAGLLSDATLLNQTPESFQTVFGPKVYGAWNLHRATRHDELDHFVLFSSVAGELGSPGQANHAAASTFLDGLAAYRHGLGLRALSINWGPWDTVGAAVRNGATRHAYAEAFGLIPPPVGIQKFAELLTSNRKARMGVMALDCDKLPVAMRQRPVFELLRTEPERAFRHASCPPRFRMDGKTPAEADEALRDYLKQKVSRILCLASAEEVGLDTALFDLGLDSLTTMELKESLQTELEIALKPSVFFDYPTLKALSGYLLKTLRDRDRGEDPAKRQAERSESIGAAESRQSERPENTLVAESSMRQKLFEITNELSQWDEKRSD